MMCVCKCLSLTGTTTVKITQLKVLFCILQQRVQILSYKRPEENLGDETTFI